MIINFSETNLSVGISYGLCGVNDSLETKTINHNRLIYSDLRMCFDPKNLSGMAIAYWGMELDCRTNN